MSSSVPDLIAFMVSDIKAAGTIDSNGHMGYKASFSVRSLNRDLDFDEESNPFGPTLLARCEKLLRHGFTVVQGPDDSRNLSWSRGWKDEVINRALKHVDDLDVVPAKPATPGYDPDIARAILEILDQDCPSKVSLLELKFRLKPEPNDKVLTGALDVLQLDHHLESIYKGGFSRLMVQPTATVRITGEGRGFLGSRREKTLEQSQMTVEHLRRHHRCGRAPLTWNSKRGCSRVQT